MRSKTISLILLFLMILSTVASVQLFPKGSANPSSIIPPPPPLPRIYIRADGRIDPVNSPVQKVKNVYTLIASLTEHVIEVQCDNVIVDGAGNSMTGKAYENGIVLSSRRNVVVKNFVLKTFSTGIYLWNSTSCAVEGNIVTNSSRGIILTMQSKNNVIRGNAFKENMGGIYVSYSGNNQFRSNIMQDNRYNLQMELGNAATPRISLSDLVNDIDSSNTVNGKPVCYWINQENNAVPSDSGCVILIGCKGINVQNLNLYHNGCGALLFATTDSTISNNAITGNGYGVWADSASTRLTIENNAITDNSDDGISLVGSNDNYIMNSTITENRKLGIRLEDSKHCSVIGNTIKTNYYGGIGLGNVSDMQISENLITDHKYNSRSAISLGLTLNSTVAGNTLENNGVGLFIHDLSKGNIISANVILNNGYGIWFYYTTMYGPYQYPTSSNTFRNNQLNNNVNPLKFESSFVQDIDASNAVNGKSIYYWVNQQGKAVPTDAGCIVLLNCDGITVENVAISGNTYGIMLFGTSNCVITKSTFSGNSEHGIYLRHSNNNILSQNEVFSNLWDGVYVEDSSNNKVTQSTIANNIRCGIEIASNDCTIAKNNVTSNKEAGIKLNGAKNNLILDNYVAMNEPGILLIWGTSNCKVTGNTITQNNNWGLRIEGSKINSTIHHNNFINNKVNQSLQVSIPWPADPNVWDNAGEGNYWSDYQTRYPNSSEIGNTGVGDTAFYINENNIDHFPLMKPIGLLDSSPWSPLTGPEPDNNSSVADQGVSNRVKTEIPNLQILALTVALAAGFAAVLVVVKDKRAKSAS